MTVSSRSIEALDAEALWREAIARARLREVDFSTLSGAERGITEWVNKGEPVVV
jgi:hypothetical protein